MFESVGLTKLDMDESVNDSFDDADLGLRNPISRITCLVLYLYSIEMGNPPLYAEINRLTTNMDP